MKKDPLKKLIKLDIKLCKLELRGEVIREAFNEMMERKQERYSFLLGAKNDLQNPEHGRTQVKKEIKELETFIKFYSETLTSWDFSIDQRNEFYQQWTLSNVLKIENKKKRRAFLNSFPEMHETLEGILEYLKNLIAIQGLIISRLEGSVEMDKEAKATTDLMPFNLN